MSTGEIAQLIVPSDGIGNPTLCLPDWSRALLYFVNGSGFRRYQLVLETQSPALSVAASMGGFTCGAVDVVTGALIIQSAASITNGEPILKIDPTSLTETASYGVSTGSPSYPTSFWIGEGMICVACGTAADPSVLVGYAFLKESAFQPSIDGFRVSDTLVASGFQQSVTPGASANRCIMCAGASGPSGASVFITWNGQVNGPTPTIPLQRIVITPGAENYNIASWPTPNPDINISLLGSIAAASVDATWTNLAANAMVYDPTDGNVLIDVFTNDAVTTKHYLIKVNGSTSAVIWASAVLPNASGTLYNALNGSQTSHGTLGLIDFTGDDYQLVTTSSGAVAGAALTGILFDTTFAVQGGVHASVTSSDTVALYFLSVSYLGGGGPATPAPVAGTPSTFTGYALIGGIIPPPVIVDDFAVGDLWFGPTAGFIDLRSIANRRLFIGGDGSTTFLGTDGSRPFGSPPPIFLTLATGQPAADFPLNAGTGGAFTLTGPALVIDASIPPCSTYTIPIPGFNPNTPPGADPQIILSVSDDGGRTWSALEKPRSIGKIGEYLKRIRWLKMGQFRQRIIRLVITDPVKRRFVGFYADLKEGME